MPGLKTRKIAGDSYKSSEPSSQGNDREINVKMNSAVLHRMFDTSRAQVQDIKAHRQQLVKRKPQDMVAINTADALLEQSETIFAAVKAIASSRQAGHW